MLVTFDVPTQVMYYDTDGSNEENGDLYHTGIAYKDEIICACCGGVVAIEDVIDFTPRDKRAIIAFENWVDFSEETGVSNEQCVDEDTTGFNGQIYMGRWEEDEDDDDSYEDDDDADCFCDETSAFDVEAWTEMNRKIWAAISGKGN